MMCRDYTRSEPPIGSIEKNGFPMEHSVGVACVAL